MVFGKKTAALILPLLLWACHEVSPEEQAAQAARGYYAHLVDDRPEEFLAGKAGADSLPDDYRWQLVQAYVQYMADMEHKHGGLARVDISPNVARRDTSLQVTYAFLLLCYGDSTQEEIAVPMTETDGGWMMK